MHRNSTIREYNGYFDSWLNDQESLLIQLCDHLFRSGFVFQDSSETEIEAGGSVIRDFFDQEADVLRELVPRKRFSGFSDYVKNYGWSEELLQKKLCQRIRKAFDQLAKGKHHHFNIRYNISHGLRQSETHPLYDLLLFIETYYSMILVQETPQQEDSAEEPDFSKTKFMLEDLMKLRSQLQEHLEGRQLVKGFMKHIAKERGVTLESLAPSGKKQDRQFPKIKFIRPSKQTLTAEKQLGGDVSGIIETPENIAQVEKYEIKSNPSVDQDEQIEINLEPDLEQFAVETADEKIQEKKEVAEVSAKIPEDSEKSLDVHAVDLLNQLEEDEEYVDEDEAGLLQDDADETDVVFGSKKITQDAIEKFVRKYSDSTLKFLFRKTLDGRPLPAEIEDVYSSWEKRGLSRGRLKKYVLKLMEWPEVPEMPILDLLQLLRDRIFEVSQTNQG